MSTPYTKLLDRHTIGRTLALRVPRKGKLMDLEAIVAGQSEGKAPRR